jgi:hypothetical protein
MPFSRDEPALASYLSAMTVHTSPPPILETAGVDPSEALSILENALVGADDGELFLERSESGIPGLRRRPAEVRRL